MLGPIVGVAAMVGAVGLTESAKGDLKAKLAVLGTNLIIAQAGGSFGSQNPTFPDDAVHRVEAVSTVTAAAATADLSSVVALPTEGGSDYYQAFPVPVRAADLNLPSVLEVPVIDGRWLSDSDIALHARSVVLGAGLAKQYAYLPGETRTIKLNNTNYGVVGVLGSVALDPDLDNAVFITQWAAKHDFATDGKPNKLYVRSITGKTQETADAIPTAINLGGPDQVSTKVPSDVLQASAQADKTLQQTALFAGLLALAVGGLGIANVMSISVIQRSSEIGIRRAVGHSRSKIAVAVPARVAVRRHPRRVRRRRARRRRSCTSSPRSRTGSSWSPTAGSRSGWASRWSSRSRAGLYPSIKAARLEPLETLRLGLIPRSRRRERVPSAGCEAGSAKLGGARRCSRSRRRERGGAAARHVVGGRRARDDRADDHVRPAGRPHAQEPALHRHRVGFVGPGRDVHDHDPHRVLGVGRRQRDRSRPTPSACAPCRRIRSATRPSPPRPPCTRALT